MHEDSSESQLWLLLNYQKIVHPEAFAAQVAEEEAQRQKKRAKAEEAFDALVQKRMRK